MFGISQIASETLISDENIPLPDGQLVEVIPPPGAAGYFCQVRPGPTGTPGTALLRYGQSPDVAARIGFVLVAESADGHWIGSETLNLSANHPFLIANGADLEIYIVWVR